MSKQLTEEESYQGRMIVFGLLILNLLVTILQIDFGDFSRFTLSDLMNPILLFGVWSTYALYRGTDRIILIIFFTLLTYGSFYKAWETGSGDFFHSVLTILSGIFYLTATGLLLFEKRTRSRFSGFFRPEET